MSNKYWVVNSSVTSSGIGDEIALLDVMSGQYFTLNETGTYVWKMLTEKQATADLVQSVALQFDVAPDDCKDDIDALIHQLSTAGLIREA